MPKIGNIPWNKGLKGDPRLNKKVTWGDKIGKAKIGHKVTQETKDKLREHSKKNINWSFKNHRHSKESITKMKSSLKGRIPWNKGIGNKTELQKKIRGLQIYKDWRLKVFVRDNFKCVGCGIIGNELAPHHIKAFSLLLDENGITTIKQAESCKVLWDVNNGITLCHICHKKTDSYGKNV